MMGKFDSILIKGVESLSKQLFGYNQLIKIVQKERDEVSHLPEEIVLSIRYSGSFQGVLYFQSSLKVGNQISYKMSGVDLGMDKKAIKEGISEYLNQLMGVIKRNESLNKRDFHFELPNLNPVINNKHDQSIEVNVGDYQFYLSMIEN